MKLRGSVMKNLTKILGLTLGLLFSSNVSATGLDVVCKGETIPLNKIAWTNGLPITIGGLTLQGSTSEHSGMARTASMCMCPSNLTTAYLGGMKVPGINIVYWSPEKMLDISRVPSCSIMLGGKVLFGDRVNKLGNSGGDTNKGVAVRHIIDWGVDLFGVMSFLEGMLCSDYSGFLNLAADTSIDPRMDGLPTGATGEAESALFFSTLVGFVPGAAEAVSIMLGFNLDFIPFVAGAQTNTFPYRVESQSKSGTSGINFDAAVRHIFRQSASFVEWVSVGPTAECFTHPFYFPIKSAYRYNRLWPFADYSGRRLRTGMPLLMFDGVSRNTPMMEDALMLIWKNKQCCFQFGL